MVATILNPGCTHVGSAVGTALLLRARLHVQLRPPRGSTLVPQGVCQSPTRPALREAPTRRMHVPTGSTGRSTRRKPPPNMYHGRVTLNRPSNIGADKSRVPHHVARTCWAAAANPQHSTSSAVRMHIITLEPLSFIPATNVASHGDVLLPCHGSGVKCVACVRVLAPATQACAHKHMMQASMYVRHKHALTC